MKYWNEIKTDGKFDTDKLKVQLSWEHEDWSIRDAFDSEYDDVEDIIRKVDNYDMYWIMLRAQVKFDGVVIGESHLGGILIDYPDNIVTEDSYTCEDLVSEAMDEAKSFIEKIKSVTFE